MTVKLWVSRALHLVLAFFMLGTLPLIAQQTEGETDSASAPRDSIVVSLLTCSPGTDVYELYGHTALRVQDFTRGQDWAFNYGVFNFNAPHFIWRFTLGQCDYMIDAIPFKYFIREYQDRGSSVTQQTLNLTSDEALQMMLLLAVNMRLENRTYRYNFLTNNCTTKVRDRIEEAVDGRVLYMSEQDKFTYRQLLHLYTNGHPWAELGDDILLGAAVDTVLADRAAMFLPERLMKICDKAIILDPLGNERPLVAKTEVIVPLGNQVSEAGFPLSPLACSLIFLTLCLAIVYFEWRKHKMIWGWDIVLMLFQGLSGLLLVFLFLFSEHPSLNTNWQIWILNPLPLFCIPWVIRSARKHQFCLYHYLNAAILTLFIIFAAWIPQDFCDIIVPLALVLLTRPISYYLYYRKKSQ